MAADGFSPTKGMNPLGRNFEFLLFLFNREFVKYLTKSKLHKLNAQILCILTIDFNAFNVYNKYRKKERGKVK